MDAQTQRSAVNAFVAHCMRTEKQGGTIVTLDPVEQVELVLFIKDGAQLMKKMRDHLSVIIPEHVADHILVLAADEWLKRV